MRSTNRVTGPFSSLIFLTLLSVGPRAYLAQQQLSKEGPLPEALESAVNSRQELIRREFATLSDNEWSGVYYSEDGLTAGTQLYWAPAAGFVIKWSTCSYGWRERANYGSVIYKDGSLRLIPELSGDGSNVYSISADFTPVLWGEQHYLVPSNQLINFCYAAKNADNSPQINAFLRKVGDDEKRRKGLPRVPPEYQKYLNSKPIVASISSVKTGTKPWIKLLTLDVGSSAEVVPGMKFYVSSPRNIFMLVEVTEVREHSSEAYVITSGVRGNSKGGTGPSIGWRLTSRAPKDASYYEISFRDVEPAPSS